MIQNSTQMKDLIEVKYFFYNFPYNKIGYFNKNNKEKEIENQKGNKNKASKKTEFDNNDDDDWGDDKNDFFDYGADFCSKKKTNDNIQPVDIRKIGQVSSDNKKRCDITYLGNGFSDDIKLCDNLICTECCCKVLIFKDQMWDVDVNYLFFRNNFSTPEKLKQKLVESYGTYAYSCQCSWKNISDEFVDASQVSSWTCSGH